MIQNYIENGIDDLYLDGFENGKKGDNNWFNFILNTGDKT